MEWYHDRNLSHWLCGKYCIMSCSHACTGGVQCLPLCILSHAAGHDFKYRQFYDNGIVIAKFLQALLGTSVVLATDSSSLIHVSWAYV